MLMACMPCSVTLCLRGWEVAAFPNSPKQNSKIVQKGNRAEDWIIIVLGAPLTTKLPNSSSPVYNENHNTVTRRKKDATE